MTIKTIKQYVKIKTEFYVLHCWKDCNIDEVSFLKNKHHHKILITVKIETSKDRQIEFLMLKKEVDIIIKTLFGNNDIKDIGEQSMEMISHQIVDSLRQIYNVNIEVEASEDGYMSGGVSYEQ